jgi:cytochrome c oxidase cbb3-type subunit 3
MSKRSHDEDFETTGHQWDGIREYNKPLPRWWLWTFYATILWGIGYTIAYPAWPMVQSATAGVLGYSTRAEVAQEIARVEAANAEIDARLAALPLAEVAADPVLASYADNLGASVFRGWCAQCHGAGGAGSSQEGWAAGYPNLLDDDWLWGGSAEEIAATIRHGIRSETDAETRYSQMPAFGRDGMLERAQITQVVNHVMTLSGGAPRDAEAARAGAEVFADNCASCHGADGTGDRSQGAPDLSDAIWLYGAGFEAIHDMVWNGGFGMMPAWSDRLTEAEIRAVASYVHGLGGGEAP